MGRDALSTITWESAKRGARALACLAALAALPGAVGAETWDQARAADVAQVAPGWSAPVRLEVDDANWEDSVFVAPDGRTIYFVYYPGEDLLSDFLRHKFKGNLVAYSSKWPFREKHKIRRFHLSDPIVSSGGIMIDDNGDWWYHSNYAGLKTGKFKDDIYRNGVRLPFNRKGTNYQNPHYCAARDELWFDGVPNKRIVVMRHAESSKFKAPIEPAPPPITDPDPDVHSSVPWLSRDCMTMYFVSDRGNRGRGGWIYRTERGADGKWSEPVVIVRSKIGVGEPTLTADGKRLFFAQVFRKKGGEFTSDLFYIERTGASAAATAGQASPHEGRSIAGLVGLGSSKSLDRRNHGMVWRYSIRRQPLPAITTSRGVGVERGDRGIALRLRSRVSTHVAVILDESGGARYEHRLQLAAGKWTSADIPWGEFTLQKGSHDANGRLDPGAIKQLTVLDIGAFLGGSGDNRVEFDRLDLWSD